MTNYDAPSFPYLTSSSSPVDEEELVKRFQNGEEKVFNSLVSEYQKRIFNLIYKYVPNSETAKDLSQEVFLKAFLALPHFKRQSAFYSWLYRIAINLCIDYLRKQKRSHILPFNELPTDSNDEEILSDLKPSPSEQAEMKELGQIIRKAVNQLPPGQRRVFNLRYQEGLQLKEIAARLNRSEGTIKAHLHHARRRLQTLLLPYLNNEPLEWVVNS